MLGCVLSTIVGHGNGLWVVALDGRGLSEGSCRSTQKTESEDCGFHWIEPVWGSYLGLKSWKCRSSAASGVVRAIRIPNQHEVGFELGDSNGDWSQGFAHMWKIEAGGR